VAVANVAYGYLYDDHSLHEPGYYIVHALFVGSPLICIFLTVSVFQIKLQRNLSRLANKDGLTGLDNRRAFFKKTGRLREVTKSGVLLMLDADRFKEINDRYGHHVGDICLKSIAKTLQKNTRSADVVARIGGEEFAVYMQNTTVLQAQAVGARLIMPIPFQTMPGGTSTVTLSIGACAAQSDETLDDLFVAADRALYQAKQNGRAQIAFSEFFLDGQPA
jgi:diguanylate cyclase (GGDEF)-like protein